MWLFGDKRNPLGAELNRHSGAAALVALAALGLGATASAGPRGLVARLDAELLSRPSATVTLERWCAARRLADPPTVVAQRVGSVDKPADARVRALLKARPGETILYRRVALSCGGHVLSQADNWYRPGRLTAAMNQALQTTDRPFGLVVKPLDFHRRRLEDRALPPGGEDVLRHEALLETPDGTPFSLVVETYSREVLDEGPSPSVGQKLEP